MVTVPEPRTVSTPLHFVLAMRGRFFYRFLMAPPELQMAIMYYFPPGEWGNAAEIAWREGKFDPMAYCLDCLGVTEDSRSTFQINVNAHPWAKDWPLLSENSHGAAAAAASIVYRAARSVGRDGWSPWSVARMEPKIVHHG